MATNSKNQAMRKVYFVFRCTKDKHENCISMRNTAMKSSKKILQAYTTNVKIDGTRYCVTGKALVKENEIKEFTDNLRDMRYKSANPISVKELKVLVGQ